MSDIRKKIGKRIKDLRDVFGYTQTDIALRVGLSRPNIANIEAGRQSLSVEQIEDFSSAFGIKPYQFLKGIWWNRQPSKGKQK